MDTQVLTPQKVFSKIIRYEIPVFQRPYVWTQEEQWEPLWEDVSELAETLMATEKPTPHFMGAVVLQPLPNSMARIETWQVVDGQQRLTTLQLLLDAIQEVCGRRDYRYPADQLQFLVRNPEAYTQGNEDLVLKMWPTEFDQKAFVHAMSNDLPNEEYRSSRIVMAHNFFKGQAEQWLEQSPQNENPERAAECLVRASSDCLELAVIELNSSDNPHIIFETLNARGTPLLPSDKIKNHILYKADVTSSGEDDELTGDAAQLWQLSDEWWRQETGRGHQRRPRVDIFLNNWLAMRTGGEIRANEEFPKFQQYAEEKSIHEIAEDITRNANLYRNIDQATIPEIATFLEFRRVMNAGTVIPALMWLLSTGVPDRQLLKSVGAIESFMVRRMVCGLSARSYPQIFVGMVAELDRSDGGPESVGDVVVRHLARQTAAANRWPDDSELLEAFLTNPLYEWLSAGRMNLVLRGIERGLRSDLAETQEPPGNLQVEHVMPRSWHQHWPLPEELRTDDQVNARRSRLVHNIGNLTLVQGRLNARLSNSPWEEKRKILDEHAVLLLNRTLLRDAPGPWDETAIEERAKILHRAAASVWPHADAMR